MPIPQATPSHVSASAHKNRYLVTANLQSRMIPLEPAIKALIELVTLETLIHVWANPYTEPAPKEQRVLKLWLQA